MIFATGDTHGNARGEFSKFNSKNFIEGKSLTKNDYVIITGDVGFFWSKESDYWMNWISNKPWTTLFVDGNHEPFHKLYQHPTVPMFGSKVRKITDSVFHLMRGEVYTIDNIKFFTMGGAESTDKVYRVEGVSWWGEEIPTYQEFEYGLRNLDENSNEIDYIISHTAPKSAIRNYLPIFPDRVNDPVSVYLDSVVANNNFKKLFCGHFHIDKVFGKYNFLYNNIVKIC